MRYDIMQVDDDNMVRMMTEFQSKQLGQEYFGASCLNDFETALSEHSAEIYIVDGRFPEEDNENPEILAPRAVGLIRQHNQDPNIILYSSEGNIEEIAEELKIHYIKKPSPNLVQEVLGMFN